MDIDQVEPNHILFRQSTNEFFKVKDIISDKKVKAQPVTPDHEDNPDKEVQVNIKHCTHCLSPHQFGQVKRYKGKGGTGFSKQGRKLKHNRLKMLDLNSKEFLEGNLKFDKLIETV